MESESRCKECNQDMRGTYFSLLELHNTNRIDYNNRKWETIKFSQSVFSALIGATIAATIAMYHYKIEDVIAVRIISTMLPIIASVVVALASKNLKRESELLFMEEGQMFKIAQFLHLDVDLKKEERWLPDEKHLLMEKWRLYQYRTGDSPLNLNLETWVKHRMKEHRFLNMFAFVFFVEFLSALFVGIYLFIPAICLQP